MPNARLVTAALIACSLAVLPGCSALGDDKPSPKPTASATPKVDALLREAIAAQARGDVLTAERLLRQVLEVRPNDLLAHYNLGVIAQGRGELDLALREYDAALRANSKHVPSLFNEATIYGGRDAGRAITLYNQVIKLQPVAPTAYLNLGLLELEVGADKQGIAHLVTALRQDPKLVSRLPAAVRSRVEVAVREQGTASPTATATASPR